MHKKIKLQLVCMLPYTGKCSHDWRTRLRRTIEKNIPFCKLNVVFRSICRLCNLFRFIDSLEKIMLSGITYRYACGNYKVSFYGKAFQHFFFKAYEHMGTENLTGKRIKNTKESAISGNLLYCDSPIFFWRFWYFSVRFQQI